MKSDKGQQHIPGGVQLEPAGFLENGAVRAKGKFHCCSEPVHIYSRGQEEECEKPGLRPLGPRHLSSVRLCAPVMWSRHVNDTLHHPAQIVRMWCLFIFMI